MFESTSFDDVDDRLRQVSEGLFAEMSAAMSGKPWKFAMIDMRWTAGIGHLKPCVVLRDGTKGALFDTPMENASSKADFILKAHFILDEMWKSQGEKGTKKWYGIMLTFQPAGEAELKLDYDPACGDDPTFFDD